MALWNEPGLRWSQGARWGPVAPAPPPPFSEPNHKTKLNTPMKRQKYYPSSQDQEPEWLENFVATLPGVAAQLTLTAAQVEAAVADARWLIYVIGGWVGVARTFPEAATAAAKEARAGVGSAPLVLPVLTLPPLPAGDPTATPPIPPVVPMPPGALDRIFRLVKDIKNKIGYTPTIGADLRIVGGEQVVPDMPKFSVKAIQGTGCECVQITYYKYGRAGVYIESRRGAGAWEFLAISSESPYLDERPLLVPGVPEVREYRIRFYDKSQPTGPWTAVEKVTVSP